jgi:hypothetical protein
VSKDEAEQYGQFVLVSPEAIASLEKFHALVGQPMTLNSGFRGPKHQEATCESICHAIECGDPKPCSITSRHMWGDGFDLPMQFYNPKDQQLACDAGFTFSYLEVDHLHVDQNPHDKPCVKK